MAFLRKLRHTWCVVVYGVSLALYDYVDDCLVCRHCGYSYCTCDIPECPVCKPAPLANSD